jgi:hypothetical protein
VGVGPSNFFFFWPAAPFFYSSNSVGPSNHYSFGPPVPLYLQTLISRITLFRARSALSLSEYEFLRSFESILGGIQRIGDVQVVVACPSNCSPVICGVSVIFELWATVPQIILLRPGVPPYCLSVGYSSPELFPLGNQCPRSFQYELQICEPILRASSAIMLISYGFQFPDFLSFRASSASALFELRFSLLKIPF